MTNGLIVMGVITQIEEDSTAQDYTAVDEMFAQLIKQSPENKQILINYLGDRMLDKVNDGTLERKWEIHEEDYVNS